MVHSTHLLNGMMLQKDGRCDDFKSQVTLLAMWRNKEENVIREMPILSGDSKGSMGAPAVSYSSTLLLWEVWDSRPIFVIVQLHGGAAS